LSGLESAREGGHGGETLSENRNLSPKRSDGEFGGCLKLRTAHPLILEMLFSPNEFLTKSGNFLLKLSNARLEMLQKTGSLICVQVERST
jgi:hypothetical protein